MVEGQEIGGEDWLFINDWPIRRFLMVGACFLLCLSIFTFTVWLFGENDLSVILGYVFILVIVIFPGVCLLRVLRIHSIGYWKAVTFALALGIAYIYAMGTALSLFHYTGLLDQPMTFAPINIAYVLTTSILLALTYHREKTFQARMASHDIEPITVIGWMLAILLPVLALIGTSVAGYYGNRIILQYLLIALCLAPLGLLTFKIKRYEILILSVSLALLWHRSMLTNYLTGYDVFSEYVGSTYVISNGFWNVAANSVTLVGAGANTSLTVVSLVPIIHCMTGIDTIMIFKLVLPLLYSFVPVVLYLIIKDQIGRNAAVVGTLVLVGMVEYYGLMFQLGKQEMAELFLVAMMLAMFERGIARSDKRTLAMVFLIGVMVSHYAIAYLTLGVLGLMVGFLLLFNLADGLRSSRERSWISRVPVGIVSGLMLFAREQRRKCVVSLEVIAASGIFFFLWYSITASGVMMVFFRRGSNAVSNITGDTGHRLESFDMLQYILIDQGSFLHNVPKILFIVVQLLCIAGVIYAIINYSGLRKNASREYLALGLVGGVLIAMGYVVPNFSSMFYYGRLFHYALLFLAGFALIGILGHASILTEISFLRKERLAGIRGRVEKAGFAAALILVSVIMLTNTSVIYTLADNEYNNSFAVDDSVSWSIYSDSDVVAAQWAGAMEHRGNASVAADWHRFPIFGGMHISTTNLLYSFDENDTNSLIYISSWNADYHYAYPLNIENTASLTYTDISEILQQVNDTYGVPYSAGKTSYYYILPSVPESNGLGPSVYQYNNDGLDALYVLLTVTSVLLALSAVVVWRKGRKK